MADPGDTAAAPARGGPDSETLGPDADALPQGWVVIGTRDWRSVWGAGAQPFFLSLISLHLINIAATFAADGVPVVVTIGTALALVVVTVAVAWVARTRRWPLAAVSLGTGELRAGSRTVELASVDAAQIGVLPQRRREPVVTLRLSAGGKARVEAFLRDRRGATLTDEHRLVLAEALRRTSIVLPVSPDDPKGRFTRINFPGHLDRDEAVASALRPETADAHVLGAKRLYQR